MLTLRALVLAGVLAVAMAVNTFVAPQLYDPRPPIMTGPDLVEVEEWRGHSFATNTWWLNDNVPNARYERTGQVKLASAPDNALAVGINISDRPAKILGLNIDESRSAVDVTGLGVRDALFIHSKIQGFILCQVDLFEQQETRCRFFAAWEGDVPTDEPLVFIGVLTERDDKRDEMALVEKGLLERIVGMPVDSLPTLGETND
jgi:hypothetical protein